MAEVNSHSNTSLEENETLEPPSSGEVAGELPPPSQKEGDDSKGNGYGVHGHYNLMECIMYK